MRIARSGWEALPATVRGPLLMVVGCLLFSIMGALVKLVGRHVDSMQIAFFRSFFGFLTILPFVLSKKGHAAFRTTHPFGHLTRGAIGLTAMVGGFYATTRLPLAFSTAISFTAPLFMILTAILILGEVVRWRRGAATVVGFLGVLIMVRPGSAPLDTAVLVGLVGALFVALSTTLVKRLSATEAALTILVYFGLIATLLSLPLALLVWQPPSRGDLAILVLIGVLGSIGQFCTVRAYSLGELSAIAPIDYSRLIFAGIMGFLIFAELPDRYTLVGALIIVGSTLYISYREAHLSRLHRAELKTRLVEPHPHDSAAESTVVQAAMTAIPGRPAAQAGE